jgi:hypothetical protein
MLYRDQRPAQAPLHSREKTIRSTGQEQDQRAAAGQITTKKAGCRVSKQRSRICIWLVKQFSSKKLFPLSADSYVIYFNNKKSGNIIYTCSLKKSTVLSDNTPKFI